MKLKLRPGSLPDGVPFRHPASLIATFFGAGLIPFASGTWGSAATLIPGYFIGHAGGSLALIVAAIVVTLAGVWASEVILRAGAPRDPGLIVIDEVAGMLLTLAFTPLTWWGILLAFVLFRLADILKPFPANWCDARLHGGWGVMLDDIVAGCYAAIATWLISEHVLRDFFAHSGF
jgi:phosphatidylglycerophosphatase A